MKNRMELNVSGEKLGPNNIECEPGALDILFHFSDEWDKMVKVAGFARGDIEFEPQPLIHGEYCEVPQEAMSGNFFRVFVVGKNSESMLKTNEIIVTIRRK